MNKKATKESKFISVLTVDQNVEKIQLRIFKKFEFSMSCLFQDIAVYVPSKLRGSAMLQYFSSAAHCISVDKSNPHNRDLIKLFYKIMV